MPPSEPPNPQDLPFGPHRCGHHLTPLVWVSDDFGFAAPCCFPEFFPQPAAPPETSEPDAPK